MSQNYGADLWTGRGEGYAGDVEGGVGKCLSIVCGGVGVDVFRQEIC